MPASFKHRFHPAALALLLLLAAQKPAGAQSASSAAQTGTGTIPSSTPPAQPPKIPLSHLYLHFFLYEAHLEHLAEEHPIKNVNGAPIKEHLRKRIGLSPAEWQSIAASSLRMETSIRASQAQIHALASAEIQACRASPATCPRVPPNLAQVRELERQRDQSIDLEVSNLESTLGADSTAKLHTYLQGQLASQIKIVNLTPAQIQAARLAGKVAAQ